MNPATLKPMSIETENEDCEQDCLEVNELCTKPRPDLKDDPLAESDTTLYIDCSCLRDEQGFSKLLMLSAP